MIRVFVLPPGDDRERYKNQNVVSYCKGIWGDVAHLLWDHPAIRYTPDNGGTALSPVV